MPAKALCPRCGMKTRGDAHVCDPMKVKREAARKANLARVVNPPK